MSPRDPLSVPHASQPGFLCGSHASPAGTLWLISLPSPQYFKPTNIVLIFPQQGRGTVIQIRNAPVLVNEWKWTTRTEWKKEGQQGNGLAGCRWRLTGLGASPCGLSGGVMWERLREDTDDARSSRRASGWKAMLVRGEMGKAR